MNRGQMTNLDFDIAPEELAKLPRHELIKRAEARAVYNLRKSREDCEESLV
jgi:hypothetical protein